MDKYHTLTLIILVIYAQCLNIECLKVLAIFPYNGKSHHYVVEPILTELTERGDDLTVISRVPPKLVKKNRVDIALGQDDELAGDLINLKMIDGIPDYLELKKVYNEIVYFKKNVIELCVELLSDERVANLVKSGIKYDVILVEQFYSDCSLAIAHKLESPTVGLSADTLLPWHYDRLGALSNPSFIPCRNLGYGTNPTLLQTFLSMGVCKAMQWAYHFVINLPTQDVTRQILGNDVPPLDYLAKNISMVLANAYFPLHGAFYLAPNIVEVGGIHLKEPKNKTNEIQKILQEAKNGVIYFSFGSMAKMSTMPDSMLKEFQDAFSKMSETILWKWEEDFMPNKPANVIIKKWLPQLEILKHENVKAFITHAGMLSTTEAVYAGVPIMAIPLFGDQFHNAQMAKESGLGTVVFFNQITKDRILNSITEITDPKFQENVKRISKIWNDRPMSPIDTAIFWIEHVAKFGGAHLRPAAADLPLHKYLLLDLIGIVFIFILSIFLTLYLTCRMCCGFRDRSSKRKFD